MGFFDRLRFSRHDPAGKGESTTDCAEQNALRLVDQGNVIEDEGRLEDALQCYESAIRQAPTLARAHLNRGNILMAMDDTEGALAAFATALLLDPKYAGAYYNMGNAYLRSGRHEAALAAYKNAIDLKPDLVEAQVAMGGLLEGIGQLDAAAASYQRALAAEPDSFQHAIRSHLLLPSIPESLDAIAIWRERYNVGLATLREMPGSLESPGKNSGSLSFLLAYHNRNDRPEMEALCDLFRAKVPDLTVTAPHIPDWSPPTNRGRRIRVGFLSEFLVMAHTIGALYHGYIRQLDRSRFEVVLIHSTKANRDGLSHGLDASVDKVVVLPPDLAGRQHAIAAEMLDVLFYPDIGMAPPVYFLSFARLAPVQVVSWGHPDTTGLDTMDYFLSAASIEPDDADHHYTERLIRFNRLPCFFPAPPAAARIVSRVDLGLPETGVLYGCPQSLFKMHPDFDAVLAAIADGDPSGCIVMLTIHQPAWVELLRGRWAKTFPILLDRVRFLPYLPWDRFMALMASVDLLLDPLHFGSGKTMYDAMVSGTPVVTLPGRFMRGRIVAGAYRQMRVADAPIAVSREDYVSLALALGRDSERRRALRQASVEAARRDLFDDVQAIVEFEAFLVAAVAAAGRREKLPAGWRPDQPTAPAQPVGSTLKFADGD